MPRNRSPGEPLSQESLRRGVRRGGSHRPGGSLLVTEKNPSTVVTCSREVAASAETIFELIADPARQPEWDGNDNLAEPISVRKTLPGCTADR